MYSSRKWNNTIPVSPRRVFPTSQKIPYLARMSCFEVHAPIHSVMSYVMHSDNPSYIAWFWESIGIFNSMSSYLSLLAVTPSIGLCMASLCQVLVQHHLWSSLSLARLQHTTGVFIFWNYANLLVIKSTIDFLINTKK